MGFEIKLVGKKVEGPRVAFAACGDGEALSIGCGPATTVLRWFEESLMRADGKVIASTHPNKTKIAIKVSAVFCKVDFLRDIVFPSGLLHLRSGQLPGQVRYFVLFEAVRQIFTDPRHR